MRSITKNLASVGVVASAVFALTALNSGVAKAAPIVLYDKPFEISEITSDQKTNLGGCTGDGSLANPSFGGIGETVVVSASAEGVTIENQSETVAAEFHVGVRKLKLMAQEQITTTGRFIDDNTFELRVDSSEKVHSALDKVTFTTSGVVLEALNVQSGAKKKCYLVPKKTQTLNSSNPLLDLEGTPPLTTVKVGNKNLLANGAGRTAYVFDVDKNGVSSCYDGCAGAWPAILLSCSAEVSAPVGVTKRRDGSQQLTYKGRPVYLYAGDAKPGDINGDGIGGVWHVVEVVP